MTAINNLKGHIVRDGKVVYSEDLEPGLIFAVVEQYEPFYEKGNYSDSSKLWLEATITTGERHTYSNGVVSLVEADTKEVVEESSAFRDPLRKLKTKDGYRVWESVYGERHYVEVKNGEEVPMKSRVVKWCVEVPKEKLSKFFNL